MAVKDNKRHFAHTEEIRKRQVFNFFLLTILGVMILNLLYNVYVSIWGSPDIAAQHQNFIFIKIKNF